MTPIGYIVTQGGFPCTLYNASAKKDTKRGGVLVPQVAGNAVEVFTQTRDAARAIQRTQRVAATLHGPLINDWVKLTPLLSGQPYEILPLVKQDTAQLVETLKRLTAEKK